MFKQLAFILSFLLLVAAEAHGLCTPSSTQLCLNQGRFKVTSSWRTFTGHAGVGQAVPLTSDTGFFWFFSPDNVEIVLKVLDGCAINNRVWVFAGGLTDVEATVRVEDTVTGSFKEFRNPQTTAFQPVQDINAFASCSAAIGESQTEESQTDVSAMESMIAEAIEEVTPERAKKAVPREILTNTLAACTSAGGLCLNGSRFEVTAQWQTIAGAAGSGKPVQLTQDTGYFWFFSQSNVELVVKILDGCGINNRFWVFAGGLTNVRVDLTVKDTVSGVVRTFTNPQGAPFQPIQEISAFATCSGSGGGIPLKDDVVAPLPSLSIDPPSPAGGGNARVRVNVPGAASINLTTSGDGCGEFSTFSVASSLLEITRRVGSFGQCKLQATTTGNGSRTFRSVFTVEPRQLTLPPVELLGGIFRPGNLPAATGGSNAPNIGGIAAPSTLINGGTAQLQITLANPSQAANIRRILVKVPGAAGFNGYFEAPARRSGNTLIAEIRLDPEFASLVERQLAEGSSPELDALAAGQFDIQVLLTDFLGRIGSIFTQHFQTQEVGSNEVQVSLSWDTPTDVDLHVVEPSPGEEIYYGNTLSGTGGQLDLDSNAGCSLDHVNNENVTWPSGAPIRGEHIVRVDFWANCANHPANYTVTTKVCGVVKTFSGSFAPGDEDFGGSGDGVEVTRFTPDCAYRVTGMATYEDRAQTTAGLSATTTPLPIRFAQVEVRRASDNAVLATGSTRQDGSFDVNFQNTGSPGYYVAVLTRQDNEIVDQAVRDDQDQIYAQRSSGTINERNEPFRTGVTVAALAAGSAPAFNIFDVGVVGAELYQRIHGITPPHLDWLWTRGQQGSCGADVSCYFSDQGLVSVLSVAGDPDEYDDLVLLHEYGHKWQYERSRSDSEGGPHSLSDRVDPQLAWGEGSATFFGNLAKGASLYLDTTPTGVGVRFDVEELDAGVPLGSAGGTLDGNLSEAVVAAVLWDLADATNETRDTLSEEAKVFLATTHLGSAALDDRATAGVDLVDFLDGWFCKGNGSEGDADSGVRGNVIGIHQFPYDFLAQDPCP